MKKAYNILITIFGITVCVLISLLIVKQTNMRYFVVMGDDQSFGTYYNNTYLSYGDLVYEELQEERVVSNYNDTFATQGMRSGDLLKLVSLDVCDLNTNIKLSEYVKMSKYLCLTVGLNDVLERITYNKSTNTLEYDLDSVEMQIEIVGHNLYDILTCLKSWNEELEIYIIGYGVYPIEGEKIISKLNSCLKETCFSAQTNYVEYCFDGLECFERNTVFYPSIRGHQMIANYVKEDIISQ